MRIDQLPRSENVDDRRGGMDSDGGAIRIPGGRGGFGIVTLILLALIGWFLGIDPRTLIEGTDVLTGGDRTQQQTPAPPGTREAQGPDQMKDFVQAVLGSTETVWGKIFAAGGHTYEPPTLVMFDGVTRSGCGFAQSAMGRSTAPSITRSISTPPSFAISSAASRHAMPAARPASSHRLT